MGGGQAATIEPAVRPTPPGVFAILGATDPMFTGFATIVLPFVAVQQGLSVVAIASIIGMVNLASPLKLLWTPVLDMWGTLKRWLMLGVFLAIALLAVMILVPVDKRAVPLLMALGLIGASAAQLGGAARNALLVLTVEKRRLSEAAGYLQGGALVIQGTCGAAGLWIATHWGMAACALFFAAIMLPTWLASFWVHEPVRPHASFTFAARIAAIGRDIAEMARDTRRRWVMLAFLTPIGAGAASYLWAALAPDWHAGPDVIAVANGLGAALACAFGAWIYGRFVGHVDRISSFLWTAVLLVLASLMLLILPRTPGAFVVGTLIYSVTVGFSYTSFTGLQFETVGEGAVASKAALLNAFGNVPITYMPVLLGLAHDRWSVSVMLGFEAALTTLFIAMFALARPGARMALRRLVPARH